MHSKQPCHKCNLLATVAHENKFWCADCLINDHRKYNADFRRWEAQEHGKKSKSKSTGDWDKCVLDYL